MASPFSSVADFVAYWRDPTHYRYADVTGLTLTGEILPIRKYLHPSDPVSLRAEDIAWLYEALGERNESVAVTNSGHSESFRPIISSLHGFDDYHTLDWLQKNVLQQMIVTARLPLDAHTAAGFSGSGYGAPGTMIADFTIPKAQTPRLLEDCLLWDAPEFWPYPIVDSTGEPILDLTPALNLSTVEKMFALLGGSDAFAARSFGPLTSTGRTKTLYHNGSVQTSDPYDTVLMWVDWDMASGHQPPYDPRDTREGWVELTSAPSVAITTPAGQDVANVSYRPIYQWSDSATTTATDYAYKVEQYSCTNTGGAWVPSGFPLDSREITSIYIGPSTRPTNCCVCGIWRNYLFIEINFYTTIPYHLIAY